MFNGLNDYELIYLIRENEEAALNLMFKKYSVYIYKVINEYNVSASHRDDFLQEGFMTLNVAIKKFNTNYNKTFFKYFDLILRREFNRLIKKVHRYDIPVEEVYDSEVLMEKDNSNDYLTNSFNQLFKGIELEIYKDIFLSNQKCKNVAIKYNISIKKVYNTVQKIKKLIKEKTMI